MRKHIISSLTALAAVLVLSVPAALANVPNGALVCAVRADQSGIDLTQTVSIAKAPAGSTATVTAHLEAGAALTINGSPVGAGTSIGKPYTGSFNPNDPDHPLTWTQALDATATGSSIAGNVNLVLTDAHVTQANGQPGWALNGTETFPASTGCTLVIKTNTVTNTVTVQVPVPGQTIYVNVPIPGPSKIVNKIKTKIVHVTKRIHDKARFTCPAGDTKAIVYKPSIHTWLGVCYQKIVHKPSQPGATG